MFLNEVFDFGWLWSHVTKSYVLIFCDTTKEKEGKGQLQTIHYAHDPAPKTQPQGVKGWVLIHNTGELLDSYSRTPLALGQQPAAPVTHLRHASPTPAGATLPVSEPTK